MTDHDPQNILTTYQRLRRLQEHSRSDLPALMAHRAMSTFTLHAEPPPTPAVSHVRVMVYPQDPFMSEPEVRRMDSHDIRPGLVNARVQVVDSRHPIAQPDDDGNYFYYPHQPQFAQVNAFYYTTMTLRLHERYARRSIPWSFPTPRLTIDPHVGDDANAFYSEHDQLLGFHVFHANGEAISTAQSADIVSHEAAHAVLDGLRDLYNESFGLSTNAFHESFGDMTAILVALNDDSLLRRLLDITGGDLRLSNFVSKIAEYLVETVRNDDQLAPLHTHSIYLRNALNDFVHKPFDDLPAQPADPEAELGRQAHNYSRLFTGAFYDLLVGIYEHHKATAHPHIALCRAVEACGNLLVTAVELAPVGEFDFADMGLAFVNADMLRYGGQFREIVREVFVERRRIVSPQAYQAHVAYHTHLPKVGLPPAINSALAAAIYLEETLLPALRLSPAPDALIPMGTYRNNYGEAFMTYFCSRPLVLDGAEFGEFNGAKIDLFGGLTLGYDENNRLVSVIYRPPTEEDARQVRVMVAEMIRQGMIASAAALHSPALRYQPLKALHLRDDLTTSGRLVRYPTIVDQLAGRITSMRDFLLRHIGT